MAKYIVKGKIIYRKFLWFEWRVGRVSNGIAKLYQGKRFPKGENEIIYQTKANLKIRRKDQ